MKKLLFATLLFGLLAMPAAAQNSHFGMMLGFAQRADDGLSMNFNDTFKEVYYATEFEPLTLFKIKVGQYDTENEFALADETGNVSQNGQIEYLDALVEYRFAEVFGYTGLFAGPGYYRQKFGGYNETNYGLSAGVNGDFPINRQFGIVAEAAYHWVDYERDRRFVTAGIGLRVKW